jgi:hypothetical protein
VLVPDPKVVRRLLTRYAALKIAYAEKETLETARGLEDVTYTLCVMTGTTTVHDAVVAADAMLVAGGNRQDPQRGGLLGGGCHRRSLSRRTCCPRSSHRRRSRTPRCGL